MIRFSCARNQRKQLEQSIRIDSAERFKQHAHDAVSCRAVPERWDSWRAGASVQTGAEGREDGGAVGADVLIRAAFDRDWPLGDEYEPDDCICRGARD